MREVVAQAQLHKEAGVATEKEEQMLEYMKQGSDYFYWKNLPDEEKLFYDVE